MVYVMVMYNVHATFLTLGYSPRAKKREVISSSARCNDGLSELPNAFWSSVSTWW